MKHCAGQIKYLAAIRELSQDNETVRCVNISRYLGVSRSGVSKMLRCLADHGLVCEDFCNSVILTEKGREYSDELFSSYDEVYTFFHNFLRLPQDEAREQTIRFIIDFPKDTCERLKKIVTHTVTKRNVKK